MSVSDAIKALHAEIRKEIARSNHLFDDEKRTLAELLIDERELQNLTLQDVADLMGTAKTYVWELESGRSKNPSVQKVDAIASALGVNVLRVFRAALNTYERNKS